MYRKCAITYIWTHSNGCCGAEARAPRSPDLSLPGSLILVFHIEVLLNIELLCIMHNHQNHEELLRCFRIYYSLALFDVSPTCGSLHVASFPHISPRTQPDPLAFGWQHGPSNTWRSHTSQLKKLFQSSLPPVTVVLSVSTTP